MRRPLRSWLHALIIGATPRGPGPAVCAIHTYYDVASPIPTSHAATTASFPRWSRYTGRCSLAPQRASVSTVTSGVDKSTTRDADDVESLNRVIPLVYDQLRAIAHRELVRQRLAGAPASLETTALVHEVYLKLLGRRNDGSNRAHFLALVTVAMRHILIDRAKARVRQKRGGPAGSVTLDDEIVGAAAPERLLEI